MKLLDADYTPYANTVPNWIRDAYITPLSKEQPLIDLDAYINNERVSEQNKLNLEQQQLKQQRDERFRQEVEAITSDPTLTDSQRLSKLQQSSMMYGDADKAYGLATAAEEKEYKRSQDKIKNELDTKNFELEEKYKKAQIAKAQREDGESKKRTTYIDPITKKTYSVSEYSPEEHQKALEAGLIPYAKYDEVSGLFNEQPSQNSSSGGGFFNSIASMFNKTSVSPEAQKKIEEAKKKGNYRPR